MPTTFRLYVWGKSEAAEATRPAPTEIWRSRSSRPVAIASGNMFAVVLLEDGTALAVGKGADGRLGTGDARNQRVPVQLALPVTITGIAAGERYSLFVAADGHLLRCGRTYSAEKPVLVPTAEAWSGAACDHDGSRCRRLRVQQAAAGDRGFAVVCACGAVWVAGNNDDWQRGLDAATTAGRGAAAPTATDATLPLAVPLPARATAVYMRGHSLFAATEDGCLYAWGGNAFGQLGVGLDAPSAGASAAATAACCGTAESSLAADVTASLVGGASSASSCAVVDGWESGGSVGGFRRQRRRCGCRWCGIAVDGADRGCLGN